MKTKIRLLVISLILITLFSIGAAAASENIDLNSSDVTQVSNNIVGLSDDASDIQTKISANPNQNSQDSENDVVSDEGNKNILGSSDESNELKATNDDVLSSKITVNGKWFVDIRNAYASAKNGDIIDLSGNTYAGENREMKFIDNKRVTIANAIIDASNSWKFTGISTIKNCVLENITFKNYKTTDRHPFGFENVVLRNVKFDNFDNAIAAINARNCVFENVTLSNMKSRLNETQDGDYEKGAMVVSYYSTYNNCNFINLSTNHHSGAICVAGEEGNSVNITNSKFINCSSGVGGAIYVHGNGKISDKLYSTIVNCSFINNTATQWGGALGSSQNNLIVENCEFINNKAKQGAAFMVGGITHGLDGITEGHNNIMKNCYFYNNTGSEEGGAVHMWGDNSSAINCTFKDNYAVNGKGAAIYVKGENATIIESEFYDHESEMGTVYILGKNAEIINSTFENNTASKGGDGAYIEGDNSYIENSTFVNNNATEQGGALHLQGDHIKILKSIFNSNHAHPHPEDPNCGLGGAIYIIGNNNDIAYCEFTKNIAVNGSAIYNRGSQSRIEDVKFIDNQAWSYLLITTATPNLSNYSKTNNVSIKVTHIGGANIIHAIYNDGDVTDIIFFNVTYEHSTAHDMINTGNTDVHPKDGAENSEGGKLIYQDSREDSQTVRIIVVKEKPSNGLLGVPEFDGDIIHDGVYKTNYLGAVSLDLVGLEPGTYTVYAEHPENTLYTFINNVTRFEISPYVDLSISKSSDRDSYLVGDIATFEISVESLGSDASNVVVSEMLPNSFDIISYTASKGEFNTSDKSWKIGSLKSEEKATLTLKVKVTEIGTFTNTVNVTSDDEDVNLTNNIANATIKVENINNNTENETDDETPDNSTDDIPIDEDIEIDEKITISENNKKISVSNGKATGNPILLVLISLLVVCLGIRRRN